MLMGCSGQPRKAQGDGAYPELLPWEMWWRRPWGEVVQFWVCLQDMSMGQRGEGGTDRGRGDSLCLAYPPGDWRCHLAEMEKTRGRAG